MQPASNARNSASASARRGASRRSTVGSLAWLRYSTLRSSAPARSNRSRKRRVSRGDADAGKDDRERLSVRGTRPTRRSAPRGRAPGVRAGEHRQLLTAHQRVHSINRGDARSRWNPPGGTRTDGVHRSPQIGASASPTRYGQAIEGSPRARQGPPEAASPTADHASRLRPEGVAGPAPVSEPERARRAPGRPWPIARVDDLEHDVVPGLPRRTAMRPIPTHDRARALDDEQRPRRLVWHRCVLTRAT